MRAIAGILAAGASSRMRGRDKLTEAVGGEMLLARQIRLASEAGLPVLVALPPGDRERARIVAATGATAVEVADAASGMGRSISALALAADRSGADALVLVLGDMPEIEATDLAGLVAAAAEVGGVVVRAATADGRPGHPVVFPRALFAALARLDGDLGARDVIAAAPSVRLVRLAGERAATDLDTPEAWAAWRAARGEPD